MWLFFIIFLLNLIHIKSFRAKTLNCCARESWKPFHKTIKLLKNVFVLITFVLFNILLKKKLSLKNSVKKHDHNLSYPRNNLLFNALSKKKFSMKRSVQENPSLLLLKEMMHGCLFLIHEMFLDFFDLLISDSSCLRRRKDSNKKQKINYLGEIKRHNW